LPSVELTYTALVAPLPDPLTCVHVAQSTPSEPLSIVMDSLDQLVIVDGKPGSSV
jgi:hypothetical protein